MSQKYPLGRIHPHGSRGKSAYQNAWRAATSGFSIFGAVLGVLMMTTGLALSLYALFTEPSMAMFGFAIVWAGWRSLQDEQKKC